MELACLGKDGFAYPKQSEGGMGSEVVGAVDGMPKEEG
jgi:hypothetical protein